MTAGRDREITVDEAAAILGASPRTVRRWCKAGKLLGRQVDREDGKAALGREWRIDADSAEALAATLTADKPTRPILAANKVSARDSRVAAELQAIRGQLADLSAQVAPVLQALPAAQEEREQAIQAAAQGQEKITEALGALQALVTTQAEQLGALRAELQEARKPFWRRIFGGRKDLGAVE